MDAIERLVLAYGLRVEVTDLGGAQGCEVRAEFDAAAWTIRLNGRMLDALPAQERRARMRFAIAHELFHCREYRGEVPLQRSTALREESANEFARSLVDARP